MTDYPFDAIVAIDRITGDRVVNGTGQVFALDDTARANPLPVFDLTMLPIPGNTLTTNSEAYIPNFKVQDHWRVLFLSGTKEVIVTSYEGLKEEAAASAAASDLSRVAAETAATNAATEVQAQLGATVTAAEEAQAASEVSKQAAIDAANLVEAPTDVAMETLIEGPTLTRTALNAAIDGHFSGYDIVVGAGQSNAEQSDTTLSSEVVDARLRKWNPDTSAIEIVPASETYLLPAFARKYLATLPKDRRVLIVPTAKGSTSFTESTDQGTTWSWDRTNTTAATNLYARMIARANAAKAAANAITGTTNTFVALLWSQGEGDTPFLTETAYAAKLDDLINTARTDLGVTLLPVLIGSMTPEYTKLRGQPNTGGVAAALSDTPRRRSVTAFVWGPAGHTQLNTPIHYSTAGQIKRGELFLNALYRARVNLTATKPAEPVNVRVARSEYRVTATWEPAMCRIEAVTAEVSTDRGATWSAMVIDPDSRLAATTGVDDALPVMVRVRNTNGADSSAWVTTDILPPVKEAALPAPTWVKGQAFPAGLDSSKAGILYAAYTLPHSGGTITVSARASDFSSYLSLSVDQAAGVGRAETKTPAQALVRQNLATPLAAKGTHVAMASINAGATSLTARRDYTAAASTAYAGGPVAFQTSANSATGGASVGEIWFYHDATHDAATQTRIMQLLAARSGAPLPTE